MFPLSDHFPLGRPFSVVAAESAPPSSVRPFGLTTATAPRRVTVVDRGDIGYDSTAQVGLIRSGGVMVPLSKHTDGQTNTVTQGGDGHGSNRDSDTDYRED